MIRARTLSAGAGALAIIGADWATKAWASATLIPGSLTPIAPGLALTVIENSAFGAFGASTSQLAHVAWWTACTGAAVLCAWRALRAAPALECAAWTLAFAGATANAMDRAAGGTVTDFAAIGPFATGTYAVVNCADAALATGLAIATATLARRWRQRRRARTAR